MSDPAVEAARQAYPSRRTRVKSEAVLDRDLNRIAELGAWAALRPVRELHHRVEDDWAAVCDHCWGPNGRKVWPCDTALLVYTAEELS